jgi:hypothetical protein
MANFMEDLNKGNNPADPNNPEKKPNEEQPQKGAPQSGQEPNWNEELENLEKGKGADLGRPADGQPPARSELDKATFTFRNIAKRIKDLGGNPNELIGDGSANSADPASKPTVIDEDRTRSIFREENQKMAFQNYVFTQVQDPVKAKVVLWHYQNSLRPTGDLLTDFDNAHFLAQKKIIKSKFQELGRINTSNNGTNSGTASPQKPAIPQAGEFSQAEREQMAKMGVTPEEVLKTRESGRVMKRNN